MLDAAVEGAFLGFYVLFKGFLCDGGFLCD